MQKKIRLAISKKSWGRCDSNTRRPKSRDLQSLAIATMRHPRKGQKKFAGERT